VHGGGDAVNPRTAKRRRHPKVSSYKFEEKMNWTSREIKKGDKNEKDEENVVWLNDPSAMNRRGQKDLLENQ